MPGTCQDCGHSTIACDCDVTSFKDKGFQVHGSVRSTQTKRRYFDSDAVNHQLGGTAKDRKARMEHDTEGRGYAKQGRDGRTYARNRKTKEIEAISPQEVDTYLR